IGFGVNKVIEVGTLDKETFEGFKTYMLATGVAGVVLAPLTAIAQAVSYHDLRTEKEGVNVDELIQAFD
ncbi:MAG: hypothetical protein ABFS02_06030, partial [Pseudomonadota bacterium]